MHFGTGTGGEEADGGDADDDDDGDDDGEESDPFILEDHLADLAECHKFSKSVFFIVSKMGTNSSADRLD